VPYDCFGSGTILGFQNSILWMLLVLAVFHATMLYTPFGNRLAIGGHKDSALLRGVRARTAISGSLRRPGPPPPPAGRD
jgi:ribose/xylose/arabinose/galactoside ABC-type transport system permease subunit